MSPSWCDISRQLREALYYPSAGDFLATKMPSIPDKINCQSDVDVFGWLATGCVDPFHHRMLNTPCSGQGEPDNIYTTMWLNALSTRRDQEWISCEFAPDVQVRRRLVEDRCNWVMANRSEVGWFLSSQGGPDLDNLICRIIRELETYFPLRSKLITTESAAFAGRGTTAGHVYLLGSPLLRDGFLKIGCTINLENRLKDHRSSLHEAFYAHVWPTDDHLNRERQLHLSLNIKRLSPSSEYFAISVEEAIDVYKTLWPNG